ncbi:MAG: serine hydroxymethyltransferase, partial [Acutalibacteraceae bacterium]|nr:serine hydroxymethyltransferase [Acutalibacteraceae bacterium]
EYQIQIVKNAKALCNGLIDEGFDIVSGGTDNHLMLLKLIKNGITGKELEHRLDEVHITANKNTVPNDPQSPFITSGVRLGTPAVTTRGFKEPEMAKIAKWISLAVNDFENSKETISSEVQELCSHFPIYR